MGVFLIGQWLRSIEEIFKAFSAESERLTRCNLSNSWGNSIVANL